MSLQLSDNFTLLVPIACVVFLILALSFARNDYLHPAVTFIAPWSMILCFSVIPISRHARPMEPSTYYLLLSIMFAWLFGCASAPAITGNAGLSKFPTGAAPPELASNHNLIILIGFALLFVFAAINIVYSGFVPIISLLTTGNARYLEFGVPSVYGAFLAYSNALACLAYYVRLRTARRLYSFLAFGVFMMHILLVTRQNLITLVVELFVIRCLTLARFSRLTMATCVFLALSLFSLLGSLRSGNAQDIFDVDEEFHWVPNSIVWVYAYSYFNALNIDNTVSRSGAPYFDGFMLQTLLPSILRPTSEHDMYIEVETAAASSYIYPVYMDIGKLVVGWTALLSLLTAAAYSSALRKCRFVDIATYSCLFFCALLSFFVDFWLYLPVIFQIVFFHIFQKLAFTNTSDVEHESAAASLLQRRI